MYTVEAEVDVEAETKVGTEVTACILYCTEQKLLVVVILLKLILLLLLLLWRSSSLILLLMMAELCTQ